MGLFNIIKKKAEETVQQIGKSALTMPDAFVDKINFIPVRESLLDYERDVLDMTKLALSENPICRLEDSPNYGIDLNRGTISLPLKWYTSAQRKSATLHAAAHVSITPSPDDLNTEETNLYDKGQQVADLIEDVRVNRYLCYKYPGVMRYIKEDEQKIMTDMALGDFDEEVQLPDEIYKAGGKLGNVICEMKEEIRGCETYKEVLDVTEEILKRVKQNCDDCNCRTPTPQELVNELLGIDEEEDTPRERIRKKLNWGEGTEIPITDWNMGEGRKECEIVEKEKEEFFGMPQLVNPMPLDRGLLKYLQKTIPKSRRTRDGKLGKFDPVRFITDNKIFSRNTVKRKPPHFYFILDCSGSMDESSMQWLKNMTKTTINLLKSADIKFSLIAHSGEGDEMWYTEIEENDLYKLKPMHYNLDGSMLKTLFENFLDREENNVVFYFSDGGLPAEFPEFEYPLLLKYLGKAKSMNIPVLGIGLRTQEVTVFDDWYVVNNDVDLADAIRKMNSKIRMAIG